jgi:hypothetical protein
MGSGHRVHALAAGAICLSTLAALTSPGCGALEACEDELIPPSVHVSASPTAGSAPLQVTLRASLASGWTDSCHDEKVRPESLVWDVDGDGSADAVGLDARTVTHVYDRPGQFAASARVDHDSRDASHSVGEAFAPCSCSSCQGCSTVLITVE